MKQTTAERIGANVRAEMSRSGMSQTELADSLGILQSSVSKRLLGKIAFNVDELARVAEILDVDVTVLVAEQTRRQSA